METKKWKLIGHSHQIADTGDYDGHYEVTNGKISLLTKEDDDELILPIVAALNDSGIQFYQDDFFEFENNILKQELNELRRQSAIQKATIERLRDILQETTETLMAVRRHGLREEEGYETVVTLLGESINESEQLLKETEPIDQ